MILRLSKYLYWRLVSCSLSETLDWKKFFLSNAPTLAVWLRGSSFTSRSRNPARSLGQALVKNLGHDVLARSARTPVLPAMRALNESAQHGQDDMRSFAGRVRIETNHPAKHSSALELEAVTRWRAAFTSGLRASCTGGAPIQRSRRP